MHRLAALCLTASLAAAPLAAQENALPEGEMREGADLMQDGARRLFRGLLSEMEPHIRQMEDLARLLGDFDAYQAPEVLPNGDILIRRKPPGVPPGLQPPGEGETDL